MTVISHAPPDYACPFCLIAQGAFADAGVLSAPGDVVYADAAVVALVSSYQWANNPGNTLVIPRAHYENIYTLPPRLALPIQRAARAIALAMKAAYNCDGVSTRQHNEPAGNQDVWHYHLHVTPRYTGDDLYATLVGSRAYMPDDERARHAALIRAHLPPGRQD